MAATTIQNQIEKEQKESVAERQELQLLITREIEYRTGYVITEEIEKRVLEKIKDMLVLGEFDEYDSIVKRVRTEIDNLFENLLKDDYSKIRQSVLYDLDMFIYDDTINIKQRLNCLIEILYAVVSMDNEIFYLDKVGFILDVYELSKKISKAKKFKHYRDILFEFASILFSYVSHKKREDSDESMQVLFISVLLDILLLIEFDYFDIDELKELFNN
jgi:hypothetical protein